MKEELFQLRKSPNKAIHFLTPEKAFDVVQTTTRPFKYGDFTLPAKIKGSEKTKEAPVIALPRKSSD